MTQYLGETEKKGKKKKKQREIKKRVTEGKQSGEKGRAWHETEGNDIKEREKKTYMYLEKKVEKRWLKKRIDKLRYSDMKCAQKSKCRILKIGSKILYIKGAVQRDNWPQVFFIIRTYLGL